MSVPIPAPNPGCPPPFAIGFSHPPKGFRGLVGRLIAWRQGLFRDVPTLDGVENLGALSHTRRSTGRKIIEQTTPRWRYHLPEEVEGGVIWYVPPETAAPEQVARLDAACEALAMAGGKYGIWSLFHFLVTGTLGKGNGWVCTSGAALLDWIGARRDVSGIGQPWNVDIRTWITYIEAAGWTRWLRPEDR